VTDWDPLGGTDWNPLLRRALDEQYWAELEMFVEDEYSRRGVYPSRGDIFAALHLTPRLETKVVILGQDPYPGAGMTNGLAFAVPRDVQVPGSLANIYQELHDDVCVPTPDHGNLEPWARRGVLLLNATLTVRAGAARAHRRIWKAFTDAVIQVADRTDPVYILWGKVAQNKTLALIAASQRTVIESPHPSGRSAYRGFFGSKPFSRANLALVDAGRAGIDWSLPE
jgi:uracil-DNA glycosylase